MFDATLACLYYVPMTSWNTHGLFFQGSLRKGVAAISNPAM